MPDAASREGGSVPTRVTGLTHGVFWRMFRTGDPTGLPLAERAYRTPRYPEGIRASFLRDASPAIQKETVLFWFWANLKPYALTGGPYFGYNGSGGGGYGQGVYALAPARAIDAIKSEFDGILSTSLCGEIGDMLGAPWMWIDDPLGAPSSEVESATEVQAAILTRLDDLAGALRRLEPEYGGLGHNGPPEELPLSPQEQTDALAAIDQVKADIILGDRNGSARAKSAWENISEVIAKLGVWSLARIDAFWTGFAEEGGKAFGKMLPKLILAILIWVGQSELGSLIGKLIELHVLNAK